MRTPPPRWTGFKTDLRSSESETTTTAETARKTHLSHRRFPLNRAVAVRTRAPFEVGRFFFSPFFFIRVFSTTLAKTSSGQGKIIIYIVITYSRHTVHTYRVYCLDWRGSACTAILLLSRYVKRRRRQYVTRVDIIQNFGTEVFIFLKPVDLNPPISPSY